MMSADLDTLNITPETPIRSSDAPSNNRAVPRPSRIPRPVRKNKLNGSSTSSMPDISFRREQTSNDAAPVPRSLRRHSGQANPARMHPPLAAVSHVDHPGSVESLVLPNTQDAPLLGLGITYPTCTSSTSSDDASSTNSDKVLVPVKYVPPAESQLNTLSPSTLIDSSPSSISPNSVPKATESRNVFNLPSTSNTVDSFEAHLEYIERSKPLTGRREHTTAKSKESRRNMDPSYSARILAQWNAYTKDSFDWLERECRAEGIEMDDTGYYRTSFEERSPSLYAEPTPAFPLPAMMEDAKLSFGSPCIVFKDPFSIKSQHKPPSPALETISPLSLVDLDSTPRPTFHPATCTSHSNEETTYPTSSISHEYRMSDSASFGQEFSFEVLEPFANAGDLTRYPPFPGSSGAAVLNYLSQRTRSEPTVPAKLSASSPDTVPFRTRAHTTAVDYLSAKPKGRFLVQLSRPLLSKPNIKATNVSGVASGRHFLSLITRPRAFSGPQPNTPRSKRKKSTLERSWARSKRDKALPTSHVHGLSNWRPPTCWDMPDWQPSSGLTSQDSSMEYQLVNSTPPYEIVDMVIGPVHTVDPNSTPRAVNHDGFSPEVQQTHDLGDGVDNLGTNNCSRRARIPSETLNSIIPSNYSRPTRHSISPELKAASSSPSAPALNLGSAWMSGECRPSLASQRSRASKTSLIESHKHPSTPIPNRPTQETFRNLKRAITSPFISLRPPKALPYIGPLREIYPEPRRCHEESHYRVQSEADAQPSDQYATVPRITMKAKRSLPIGVPRSPYCNPSLSRSFTHAWHASSPYLAGHPSSNDLSKGSPPFSMSVSHLIRGA